MINSVISVNGAEVHTVHGQVFGPLDATLTAPISVVIGGRGSGRTSLLLSLSGRMRLSDGDAILLGNSLRSRAGMRDIRRRTGIAGFAGIDELEHGVSVAAIVRERLAWASPWWRPTPRVTDELLHELFGPVFGEYAIPDARTLVRDLNPAEEMLLRVGLALTESPEILFVDDFDALRDPAERHFVATRLAALARTGLRIVLATSDPGDADMLRVDGIPADVLETRTPALHTR